MAEAACHPLLRIVPATHPQQKAQVFFIRKSVFIDEQHFPLRAEFEPEDVRALHGLALLSGRPVGTARLVLRGRDGRIGRLAVLPPFRAQGIGLALLPFLMSYARNHGTSHLVLHAQLPALSLYLRAGFAVTRSLFAEEGVPHCRLERWLD